MSRPMRLLGILGGMLVGLTIASLLLHISGRSGLDYTLRMSVLVGMMMAAAVTYFVAVRLVLRRSMPPHAIWVILGVAILLRVILLTTPPFLSSDIFRYVWDGRVQAADINPYRYVPADPALAPLRDTAVFPMINRPDYARTIYPPMAELVYAVIGRIHDSVTTMRFAMVAFEGLGVYCLLRLLAVGGLPRERVLLYAWNPLPLWSFAGDGHADAMVVGLLGLALLLRARHRDGWAGGLLASAALVKFFPAIVMPAFLRGGKFWLPAITGLGVVIGLYALYSSAGLYVLGFLPSYRTEEGLADGSGFWLLAGLSWLGRLPHSAVIGYQLIVAAFMLALSLAIMRRNPPMGANDTVLLCGDAALLISCVMAAVSAHYPWYFAWLALPCAVAPSKAVLWLSTIPLLLYLHPLDNDFFVWPSLIYLPALGLLAFDLWARRASAPAFPTDSRGTALWPSRQH